MARWLLHALDYPLVVNLKTIIKMNAIWDNPITESHLKLMECLFGPDIPTVKGKTTRCHPHQLVSDMVSIPHELHDAQCNVSLTYGMPFF